MRKVLLLVILGALALYYIPESRLWILDMSEPAWMPVVVWNTQEEMKQVGRDVVNHEVTMGQLPNRRNWEDWLDWRYPMEELKLDAWRSPYRLQVWADSIAIISYGPDRERNTEDDFQVATPRERRRGR